MVPKANLLHCATINGNLIAISRSETFMLIFVLVVSCCSFQSAPSSCSNGLVGTLPPFNRDNG